MAFELQIAEEDQDIANIIESINTNAKDSWKFDADLVDLNKIADYAYQAAEYYNAHQDEMDGADKEQYDNIQLLNLCVQLRSNYDEGSQNGVSDLRSYLMMELAEKFFTQKETIHHLDNNFISDGELPTAQDVLPEDVLFPDGYPLRLHDEIIFDHNQIDFFGKYLQATLDLQTEDNYQAVPCLEDSLSNMDASEYTALIQLAPIYNGLVNLLSSDTPKMKEMNAGIDLKGQAYSAKEIRTAYLNDIELGSLSNENEAKVIVESVAQPQQKIILPDELVFSPEIEELLERLDPSNEFDEATRWHLDADAIPLDKLHHDSMMAMAWHQDGREVDEVKFNNLQMLNYTMGVRRLFPPENQSEIKDLRTYFMMDMVKGYFFNPNVEKANKIFEETGKVSPSGLPFIINENETFGREKIKFLKEHIQTSFKSQFEESELEKALGSNEELKLPAAKDFVAIIVDETLLEPFDATDIAAQANLGMTYLAIDKMLMSDGLHIAHIKASMLMNKEFTLKAIWQAHQEDLKPKAELTFEQPVEDLINRLDPKSDTYDQKTMWQIDARKLPVGTSYAISEVYNNQSHPKIVASKEKYDNLIMLSDFLNSARRLQYQEPVQDVRSYYMMEVAKEYFFNQKLGEDNKRYKETGELPEANFLSEEGKESYFAQSYNYNDIMLMSDYLGQSHKNQSADYNRDTYKPVLFDENRLAQFTGDDIINMRTLSEIYPALNEMLNSKTPGVQKMYIEMHKGTKFDLKTIWQIHHDDHHSPSAKLAQNSNEVLKPEPPKEEKPKPPLNSPIYNYVATPKKPKQ